MTTNGRKAELMYKLRSALVDHQTWNQWRRPKLRWIGKLPRRVRHLLGAKRPKKCHVCREGWGTMWGALIDRRGFWGRWCHEECGIYKYGVRRKDNYKTRSNDA